MRCLYCNHPDSKVVDSRELAGSIRRRRECLGCGIRFTTYERVEFPPLMVVKKDGRREPFDRDKLLTGLRKACEKRPLPVHAIERVAHSIEAELHRRGVQEATSRTIGELVMDALRDLDEIAYIRFASVYREFTDVESLRAELERLEDARLRPRAGSSQLPLLSPEQFAEPDDSAAPGRGRGRPARAEPRLVRRHRQSA